MGEMKSAYEKAMERVEKLGKLSPEEMKERKEAEYTLVGRALAERYLNHGYGELLSEEVGNYNDEEKDMVTRAAVSRLIEAIQLADSESTERATLGISSLPRVQAG